MTNDLERVGDLALNIAESAERLNRSLPFEPCQGHRDDVRPSDLHVARLPGRWDEAVSVLSVSRYLERIADHATNIAEDVVFMAEGEVIRHASMTQG